MNIVFSRLLCIFENSFVEAVMIGISFVWISIPIPRYLDLDWCEKVNSMLYTICTEVYQLTLLYRIKVYEQCDTNSTRIKVSVKTSEPIDL